MIGLHRVRLRSRWSADLIAVGAGALLLVSGVVVATNAGLAAPCPVTGTTS